jgi:hypothetical protein
MYEYRQYPSSREEDIIDVQFDFDKRILAYFILIVIMLSMICPIGVSLYFITLFVNPVKFSDYMSLILGFVSLLVTLYFGILFQLYNFGKIVQKVEKICKVKLVTKKK